MKFIQSENNSQIDDYFLIYITHEIQIQLNLKMQNQLLGNILNNIVMEKVVRDKIVMQQKEQREQEQRLRRERDRDQFDEFDDEETRQIMRKMKGQRLRMAQQPSLKIQHKRTIGQYRQIVENQFLNYVTKLKHTVVHFYHKQFQRCQIMDKHLKILSQQFPNTQFLYIQAQKAPFFVERLNIRTLPTLCIFIDGVMKDKVLGFEGLSGDQFLTYELAGRLAQSGVIQSPKSKIKDKTLLKGANKGKKNEESESDEEAD